jgi:hypothetical protein
MWVESVEQVGDEPIGLRAERLDDDARERTAVTIACLTLDALRGTTVDDLLPWHHFMEGVVRQHVSFSISEDRLEHADAGWWRAVIGRAIVRFMHENEPAPTVNRHLEALTQTEHTNRHESWRLIRWRDYSGQ